MSDPALALFIDGWMIAVAFFWFLHGLLVEKENVFLLFMKDEVWCDDGHCVFRSSDTCTGAETMISLLRQSQRGVRL